MLKKYHLRLILVILVFGSVFPRVGIAQPVDVIATRTDVAPVIDGIPTEAVWHAAVPVTDFKQRHPDQGEAPSQKTVVRVLFDDSALYVAAWMHDSSPDSIVARLGRRDASLESDLFGVFIDSHLDRRTGFYFGLNAAGTMYDGILLNDDWEDSSWDGVWEGKVSVDEHGWTAELRIPFSQLRFRDREEMVWGINFRRDIARRNEQDFLVYTPRNESGFVSRFASLSGLSGLNPPRRIEMLPYLTTRVELADSEAGDPFHRDGAYRSDVGADFKIGLGSNLTLDATVNPDFGQVEVDPAVVNLSDVETFFQENRPFFRDGASTFQFGQGGARNYWGFNWSSPQLFYSRRIGRAPRGSLPDHDFVSAPVGTRILGAAKLTGRTVGGTNVGMIHALTNRETATLQHGSESFRAEIEPLAYSGVFRAQRDIRSGFRGIGVIGTLNTRRFGDDRMRSQAASTSGVLGVDGWTFLDSERTWVLTGWMAGSTIHGRQDFITDLQRSAVHYYQRPDAGHVAVDEEARSLSGVAGRVYLNKQRGRSFVNTAVGVISPGFNSNDLGYISRADVVNAHVGAGYHWSEPAGWRRYAELGGAAFGSFDFDGNLTWGGVYHFGYVQLKNYYNINWNLAANPTTISNRRTRGGPLTLNPPGFEIGGSIGSDNRKSWIASAYAYSYRTTHGGNYHFEAGLTWQPTSNFSLGISPSFARSLQDAQWVGVFDDVTAVETYGRRYVFGDMDQQTLGASIRMNWTFSPRLSLQLFTQPLLSMGDYTGFKELRRARSYDFLTYGEDGSHFDSETYTAYPTGVGGTALAIDNPDFNYLSLRGNAVLRWEFRPGSTVFVAWTQQRSDQLGIGEMQLDQTFSRLMDAAAENIFMIKLNYWFSL